MSYDRILILRRTGKDTFALFAPKGHQLVEFRALLLADAEAQANAWMSSFSSITFEVEDAEGSTN